MADQRSNICLFCFLSSSPSALARPARPAGGGGGGGGAGGGGGGRRLWEEVEEEAEEEEAAGGGGRRRRREAGRGGKITMGGGSATLTFNSNLEPPGVLLILGAGGNPACSIGEPSEPKNPRVPWSGGVFLSKSPHGCEDVGGEEDTAGGPLPLPPALGSNARLGSPSTLSWRRVGRLQRPAWGELRRSRGARAKWGRRPPGNSAPPLSSPLLLPPPPPSSSPSPFPLESATVFHGVSGATGNGESAMLPNAPSWCHVHGISLPFPLPLFLSLSLSPSLSLSLSRNPRT